VKIGYKNQNLPLELQLDDGATGKYPTANVRRSLDGVLLDVINMSPGGSDGAYICNYVPADAGYIYIAYKVYTSNLYNVLDQSYTFGNDSALIYDKAAENQLIANKVWDTPIADHIAAGSTGEKLFQGSTGGGGGGGGSIPPELTVDRILKLDNLDAAVSTRATQSSVNSVSAKIDNILQGLLDLAAEIPSAQNIWEYAVRSLTAPVEVSNIDLSPLATKTDLSDAVDAILSGLNVWEAKGTISLNPATDTLELVAWLAHNGTTVSDATSATVELRDGDDLVVMPPLTDSTISSSGLFKFTRNGASAIILKNRTYVMKITITRGAQTYLGNVSISTY
jgi:hypothetical protein